MGADVVILERKGRYLDSLRKGCPGIRVVESNPEIILEQLKTADAVIGAIHVTGAKAAKLITREMVRQMQRGSVIVDVSIDQGGIAETSRPTTHSNPIYVAEGVIHYCVANMPGAFPRTSTPALTNATLPFVMELAKRGVAALKENPGLLMGLNIFKGRVTNRPIAELFNVEYTNPLDVIS
jgi:alanine dehydrogenase